MLRIGEAANKFNISKRALRYWEDESLIRSIRHENEYRYYDEENIERINTIVLYRKLDLSIPDIKEIISKNNMQTTIAILTRHLAGIDKASDTLSNLSDMIKTAIEIISLNKALTEIFSSFETSERIIALKKFLSEGVIYMKKANKDKQLIKVMMLPRMIVASYSVTGNTDYISSCQQTMLDFVEKNSLHEKLNFRLFGFGYESDPLDTEFTYEMWVTIPKDFIVSAPFVKKVFPGGKYISVPSYRLDLGENYQMLYDYASDCNEYELDLQQNNMRHELEEYIDFHSFFSENSPEEKKQLDLFLPIKQIFKSAYARKAYFDSVAVTKEPQMVTIPSVIIVGKTFKQREGTSILKAEIPWYKFGQSIKKTGKDWSSRIIEGSTTYVIKHCNRANGKPFYLQGSESIIDGVFGGVQLGKPLESYPDNLEEHVIQEGRYLLFAISVNPNLATSIGLPIEILYNAAKEYIDERNLKVNPDFCLEKEYRCNGKWINKVELYIPL